jgi:hypothetical protein
MRSSTATLWRRGPCGPGIARSARRRPYDPTVAWRRGIGLAGLEDRFVLAAVLIVASIVTTAVGGDNRWGKLLIVIVESVTLLVILHASKVRMRTIRIATVIVVVFTLGSAISITVDRQSLGPSIIGAMLAFWGPVVIVRRISNHARIDLETIAASLCVYLLAGIFFSYIFRILDDVQNGFFVEHAAKSAVDFLYFSYTTLTTTGYGDLTARTSLGRMLAVSEALMGQIYLVSVVALLVGNLGRMRRPVDDVLETPDDDES